MNCTHGRLSGTEPSDDLNGRKTGPAIRCCVTMLRGYKQFVSPFFPPSCRFTPTCSQYAIEAVQRRGILRGLLLAAWRLLRCHPFARGGYDPVK